MQQSMGMGGMQSNWNDKKYNQNNKKNKKPRQKDFKNVESDVDNKNN